MPHLSPLKGARMRMRMQIRMSVLNGRRSDPQKPQQAKWGSEFAMSVQLF